MEPRNEAVWRTNDQRYDKNATEPSNDPEYYVKSTDIINYLQVGTNHPTFQFDNTLRWQRHRFLQFFGLWAAVEGGDLLFQSITTCT
jgi:hypothetical protein